MEVPLLRDIELSLEVSFVIFSSHGVECEIWRKTIQTQTWSSPESLGQYAILEMFLEDSNIAITVGIKEHSLS